MNETIMLYFKYDAGRRYCQLRLVEPIASSLNSGDCFILIATGYLYLWIGEFANIIEKAKANDIYEWIRYKRELGFNSNYKCVIIEEKSVSLNETFWSLLGGDRQSYRKVLASDEDEMFEMMINESNMVYRVITDAEHEYVLEPVVESWGLVLSYNMLDENEVFVFDFGSEVYSWNGRNATNERKKFGLALAKHLFDSGYDYTKCAISPLGALNKSEEGRPTWAFLGRISQNVETILFKGKFSDWPSESTTPSLKKIGYSKSNEFTTRLVKKSPSLMQHHKYEPVKASLLLNTNEENPVNLVLEATNLGRGRNWFDPIERRGYNVLTDDVQVWKILNNELKECDRKTRGAFSRNQTYVILGKYKLVATGFRTLKGNISQHQATTGRDRQALFFWHGRNSKRNEKGASALLTMGIGDKALSSMPHVLVFEEKENAVFCQLFSGSMVVLSDNNEPEWRMFLLRGGEIEEENHLIEVKLDLENLRSCSTIFLLSTDKIFLWNGCASNQLYRKFALICANKLIANHFATFNFTENVRVEEVEEGFESKEFTNIFFPQDLNSQRENYYHSLLKQQHEINTPRLFQMLSLHGKFEAKEVLNPLRSENPCALPFYQFYLYEEKQPALFLFDNSQEIYIWQGWIDTSTENVDDAMSTKIRFNESRKCALETAIDYWNTKYANKKELKGWIVYAGLEPIEFKNLFPYWQTNKVAQESNLSVSLTVRHILNDSKSYYFQDGKVQNQKDDILQVLNRLKRDRYPLDVIRNSPLPDGVDPTRLEYYLSDEDFKVCF